MEKNILVVTSCTGEKTVHPENQLLWEDFQDAERLARRMAELAPYLTKAGDLYTGKQHLFLMDGVRRYREAGGKIDVAILSAGYGLIDEDRLIAPYEVTFNNMSGKQISDWSKTLHISEELEQRIANYDLVFFLLGDKYLRAVEWPIPVHEKQHLIFFAGNMSQAKLSKQPASTLLLMGNQEASLFGGGLIWLKGLLFASLLDKVTNGTTTWGTIAEQSAIIRDVLLEDYKTSSQIELFALDEDRTEKYLKAVEYVPENYVPDKLIAPNYKSSLSYYMPENDDRVDPGYDFTTDKHSENRNPLLDDYYAHQFYPAPCYDGILISKINIDKASKLKQKLIKQQGIRTFLRLPNQTQIMGDCGAFSYIAAEKPPYTNHEVLEYYQSLGFDYGVSVDHLIVGPWSRDENERMRRYELTLANAEEFLLEHQRGHYTFTPIGVVQGWDPASFRDAVLQLIQMGYRYVALGGLAKEKSEIILEILKEISPIIPDANFRMHLFGVAREMDVIHSFHKLGVTSFDSASPLRRAWLDSRHNYYTENGATYTAIRLPEALQGKGRFKNIDDPELFGKIKQLEQDALAMIRAYGSGATDDLETVLNALLAYDEHIGGVRTHHAQAYRDLLVDRPWEYCACAICQQVGIDVAIFRGNNRNRRRGFHNTYVYYEKLKRLRDELFAERQETLV